MEADNVTRLLDAAATGRSSVEIAVKDMGPECAVDILGNAHDLNDPKSSVGFLKTLADSLDYEEMLSITKRQRQSTGELLSRIHLYHNIAFVEKRGNRDDSPAVVIFEQGMRSSHA